MTVDIDVDKLNSNIKSIANKYNINDDNLHAAVYPYGYEKRIIQYASLKTVDVYLISNEDFIVMKLQRGSQKDIDGIIKTGILKATNKNLLMEIGESIYQYTTFNYRDNWDWFKRNYM